MPERRPTTIIRPSVFEACTDCPVAGQEISDVMDTRPDLDTINITCLPADDNFGMGFSTGRVMHVAATHSDGTSPGDVLRIDKNVTLDCPGETGPQKLHG